MLRKLGLACCILALASVSFVYSQSEYVTEDALNAVVTILLAADGQSHAVGSGLVVRSDGYIVTPYSLIRGARSIEVRLRNGETYDNAEVVATDERRNISIIRIKAVSLSYIPYGTTEETQVGSKVWVVSSPSGQPVVRGDLTLNSVQMADMVSGAGKGYRLMQFNPVAGVNVTGGLLLDSLGRSLGVVTTTPGMMDQNIAVPLTSIIGLIRSVPPPVPSNSVSPTSTYSNSYPAKPSQTPVPIPQNSVLVPQRGITPLSDKGPGSSVIKPTTIPEILAASKTIYVTSYSDTFAPEHMINALNKKPEMAEWNLSFVDEKELADLILEIDHVVFTWKYTFKLYSQRLGTVVATGSRIIWDGNLGAPYMADRFVEKVKAARGPQKSAPKADEKKPADSKKSPDAKPEAKDAKKEESAGR